MDVIADSTLPEIIPLAEITRGMTGYGLTVFQGSTIDTFTVKVIGIQKNNRPAGNMLLVEIAGHGLELSSIAQGMSGSPVFIEGRFAGALAFGWAGALRPIAGVTPASEILALPGDLPSAHIYTPEKMSLIDLLPEFSAESSLARDLSFVADNPEPKNDKGSRGQEPWPSPENLAREMLNGFGMQTAVAGSGATGWGNLVIQPVGSGNLAGSIQCTTEKSATLQAGSACGIALVTGDAQLGATGTVTWVDGDRIFMFGHPFMQRGPVELPLSTAEVLTVFPSRQMSFKMAVIGSAVGGVHHDQRAGVAGRLGKVPPMIPVQVDLLMPEVPGSERQALSYDFKVADDHLLSPSLVFWCLYNSLLASGDDSSLQTLHYQISTTWEGPGALSDVPLVLSGVTAGPGSAQALASEWMGPLSMLLNNSYHPVRLKSVKAEFSLSRPMETAKVIGLSGPRVAMEPGEAVVFKAEIEPHFGERQFVEFKFKLPENIGAGPVRVVVTSASELFNLEPVRAPGIFEIASLAGVVDLLKTPRARDTLVLALLVPGKGIVLQGSELKNLPHRLNKFLRKGNMQAQPTLADYVLRREKNVPWILQGHAVRILEVKNTEDSLKIERRP